jgi:hypothetical protein
VLKPNSPGRNKRIVCSDTNTVHDHTRQQCCTTNRQHRGIKGPGNPDQYDSVRFMDGYLTCRSGRGRHRAKSAQLAGAVKIKSRLTCKVLPLDFGRHQQECFWNNRYDYG